MGERAQRQLMAILSADVAGFSRLMAADEERTVARLKRLREEVIDPIAAARQGRLVKTAGDGFLLCFQSALDAARCAIEMQRANAELNAEAAPDERLELRVGVNLGDVILEAGDIFGDGVNIAARLQELAEPGGVALAANVHEHAAVRALAEFRDGGEHLVKNIDRPLHVWRWRSEQEPSAVERPGAASLAERCSVAVLPFVNMSGDPEQDYFADGITEDIITALSHFRTLFVIARNSTFAFKGRAVDVKRIGRELSVRYVLEGSVRKSGNRVRITAQLIDAEPGSHVWAQRYDRELTDIFDVQDDVTAAIVTAIVGRVEAAELERARHKAPANLDAYDLLLRAKDHHHRQTPEDNAEARALLEQALARDPNYAQAHAWLACTMGQAMLRGYAPMTPETMRVGVAAAERAQELDDNDSEAHRVLAEIRTIERSYDRAERHHERALALNPNDARIVAQRGELLTWLGRAEEAVPWLEKALRLDPNGADRRAFTLGRILFAARRYSEAIAALRRSAAEPHLQQVYLAACHAALGDLAAAQAAAAAARRLSPDFSGQRYAASLPFRDDADRAHLAEALQQAGLN